nr:11754_t:CDS:2 [Entrophospora candida]
MENFEVYNKKHRQELLDRIKELEGENKRLKEQNQKLIPELANKIENYEKEITELKEQMTQLTNQQLAQTEFTNSAKLVKNTKIKYLKSYDVGLEVSDADFADYLEEQDYSTEDCLNYENIENLRKQYTASIAENCQNENSGYGREEASYIENEKKEDQKNFGKKRSEITDLDISVYVLRNDKLLKKNEYLEGELDLTGFENLLKLDCQGNHLTDLYLNNSEMLQFLDFSTNKLLEVDLSGNRYLEKLYCSNNRLKNLDLRNCENLRVLDVSNNEKWNEYRYEDFNELTDMSFLSQLPNPKKLRDLVICSNGIRSNLTPFSRFTSLDGLYLGTTKCSKEMTEKRGNRFYGSLEPLKGLARLKKLDISNTDVDSGIEFLPYSLKELLYSNRQRSDAKVDKVRKLLEKSDSFVFSGGRIRRKYKTSQESIEKIDFSELSSINEKGELIIDNYPNLKEISNKYSAKIVKLVISNCPQLGKVEIGELGSVKELICENLPNLDWLKCNNLSECFNLDLLNCCDNLLTEIKLSSEGGKMERLYIKNNNFPEQDLSIFSHLVNLKQLLIGNDDSEKLDRGRRSIYNRFCGSLEPLYGLTKLEGLDISNTDVSDGLQYLSKNLKELECSNHLRPKAKVKRLDEELSLYG